MEPNEAALRERARRAYERGRLRLAFRPMGMIVAMAFLVHPACGAPELTVGAASLLMVLVTAMSWRGEVWGKAVYPGLVAGFLAALVPMGASMCGLCGGSEMCALACVLGGMAAGAVVAWRALLVGPDRARFILGAAVLASVAGAMGCALAGLGGLLGMAAGLLVPTAPALVLQRS